MLTDIFFIIAGAALVLIGADKLTDGAVGIARRYAIPEIIIGLTIVAFGTSLPEFVVSMLASINHSPDLSVGNIVGSNIFNTLMILGCTAVVAPVVVARGSIRRDIPFNLVTSVVLIVLILDQVVRGADANVLSRWDGLVLLALFIWFMWDAISRALKGRHQAEAEPAAASAEPAATAQAETAAKEPGIWRLVLMILAGLVGLIFGGEIFVRGASDIATQLGVSEAVIGLTIVACGTSLPELATSVMAARKGSSDIALGNVVGSNVFNILWILGFCSVIAPLPAAGLTVVDYAVMALGLLLVWLFALRGRINRLHGAILIAVFGGYMCWLLMNV